MSNLLIIEGIHYAIQGGRHSEEDSTSSVYFYRLGVHFTVEVDKTDVVGTPFEEKWLPTIVEPRDETGTSAMKNWSVRWGNHCHLVIMQSLSLLDDLAPGPDRWETLEDYLTTPSYVIKLARSGESRDAVPLVVNGPKPKPAFSFHPFEHVDLIFKPTEGLPRFAAADLVVLGQADDYRAAPHTVHTRGDTKIYSFIPYKRTATQMPSYEARNDSLDLITTCLQIYGCGLDSESLPRLAGLVTTPTSPASGQHVDIFHRTSSTQVDDDNKSKSTITTTGRTKLNLAGILIEQVPTTETQSLAMLSRIQQAPSQRTYPSPWATPPSWSSQTSTDLSKPTPAEITRWEESLLQTFRLCHEHQITIRFVNIYTLQIITTSSNNIGGNSIPYISQPMGQARRAIPHFKPAKDLLQPSPDHNHNHSSDDKEKKKGEDNHKDKMNRIESYTIKVGDFEEQKEKDLKMLREVFDKVREALGY